MFHIPAGHRFTKGTDGILWMHRSRGAPSFQEGPEEKGGFVDGLVFWMVLFSNRAQEELVLLEYVRNVSLVASCLVFLRTKFL